MARYRPGGQNRARRRFKSAASRKMGGRVPKKHLGGPVHNHPHRAKTMNQPRGNGTFNPYPNHPDLQNAKMPGQNDLYGIPIKGCCRCNNVDLTCLPACCNIQFEPK